VVVPKLSTKELRSLLEMLAELEGACAKFAARRMDGAEQKALRVAQQACESAAIAEDFCSYLSANKGFHELIYVGARDAESTDALLLPDTLLPTTIQLPGGESGIGLDDLRYSRKLGRVLVPAGRTGNLDLIDPVSGATELGAQVVDVDLDRVRCDFLGMSEDMVFHLLLGDDAALAALQRRESSATLRR
jgi:hypothetical protein